MSKELYNPSLATKEDLYIFSTRYHMPYPGNISLADLTTELTGIHKLHCYDFKKGQWIDKEYTDAEKARFARRFADAHLLADACLTCHFLYTQASRNKAKGKDQRAAALALLYGTAQVLLAREDRELQRTETPYSPELLMQCAMNIRSVLQVLDASSLMPAPQKVIDLYGQLDRMRIAAERVYETSFLVNR